MKYNINISYVPPQVTGWATFVTTGPTGGTGATGGTSSYQGYNYSSPYYVASIPAIQLTATGSTPGLALSNVLIIVPS